MNYLGVKPLKNKIVDDFIANNNLFAIFNKFPINVIFLDNFINNIDLFRDIFVLPFHYILPLIFLSISLGFILVYLFKY